METSGSLLVSFWWCSDKSTGMLQFFLSFTSLNSPSPIFLKSLSWLTHIFGHFVSPAPHLPSLPTFPLSPYIFLHNTNSFLVVLHSEFSQGSSSLRILPSPFSLLFKFLGELFFIPQRMIHHLYYFWHMRILNLSLLFVLFLLVVGPHCPKPISCVFSYADVCNESKHSGAPQRKHSYSTITRATVLNDLEEKNKC